MYGTRESGSRLDWRGRLRTPRRNHFFHGKMMDVYHFELETDYIIAMRRLLNRLVTGYGVVCGLDIERGDDPCSIRVTPGTAIDGWGREIVVPSRSPSQPIPSALIDRVCNRRDNPRDEGDEGDTNGKYGNGEGKGQSRDEPRQYAGDGNAERQGDHDHHSDRGACVTALLCYHECESDPVAVLAGDCSTSVPCAPGTIREQYRIDFVPGCVKRPKVECRFPDILQGGEIDYGALARWVTEGCPPPRRNPCVPLANLRLDCRDGGCSIYEVEIEIRPIVLGNDLLLDVLSRLVEEERPSENWRR